MYHSEYITVLRVSDNTVVRAARFPYVDGQTSDPYTSKTLKVMKMSLVTRDYVVKMTLHANFGVRPPKGGGPPMW